MKGDPVEEQKRHDRSQDVINFLSVDSEQAKQFEKNITPAIECALNAIDHKSQVFKKLMEIWP